MNKYLKIGGSIAFVVFVYEGIMTQRHLSQIYQDVEMAAGQVQNVLARQAELIPNAAQVAMQYAKHEKETFAAYAQGRSVGAPIGDNVNDPNAQKRVVDNAALASQALLQLRNIQEAVPELKANENFRRLLVQLEGSINRVTVERFTQQKAVKTFNKELVQFPTNVIAGLIGYHALPYFQAGSDQQRAPDLGGVFNK